MALNGAQHTSGLRVTLLAALTISTAIAATATTPVTGLAGMNILTVETIFLYGAGGTTTNAYIQTSLDLGVTWFDVMNFSFTTAAGSKILSVTSYLGLTTSPTLPVDGSLASDTIKNGILGDRMRLKYVTTGTYSGATSLAVFAIAKG